MSVQACIRAGLPPCVALFQKTLGVAMPIIRKKGGCLMKTIYWSLGIALCIAVPVVIVFVLLLLLVLAVGAGSN